MAHAYQRLRAGGIPPEHIISLQYGDVPWDSENPYPGKLFNRPTGSRPGHDVNHDFRPTFGNASVTAEQFLDALQCSSGSSSPCVASTSPTASLFIFWAGHGGDGLLFMPDMKASSSL